MSDRVTRPEDYGTEWCRQEDGDNLAELLTAFGESFMPGDETRATDLRLTGRPITAKDFHRLPVITVGRLGSFKRREMRVL